MFTFEITDNDTKEQVNEIKCTKILLWLRALGALLEDRDSIHSTTEQLTTLCNSSFKGLNALSGTPEVIHKYSRKIDLFFKILSLPRKL